MMFAGFILLLLVVATRNNGASSFSPNTRTPCWSFPSSRYVATTPSAASTATTTTAAMMSATLSVETKERQQQPQRIKTEEQQQKQQQHQDQQHAEIIQSFQLEEDFNPIPWLSNCHVQTIAGFLLRSKQNTMGAAYLSDERPLSKILWEALQSKRSQDDHDEDSSFWDRRERVETPDGDWFHADTKYAATATASNGNAANTIPTVLLLHGLESNSDSPSSQDMANAFVSNGMNCVCLNFRGCSGSMNDQFGGYHLGFTDDVMWYLERMRQQEQPSTTPIFLSGFSLGANVVLKCLGELGARARVDYNIQGAAVLCAPLDQTRNHQALQQEGINKRVYTQNLVRNMQARAQEQWELFGGDDDGSSVNGNSRTLSWRDYQRGMQATTVPEFEDAFLAPLYGFRDFMDYYEQTSSIHYLDDIAVPTLILNAKDDPFFDPTVWPTHKSVEYGGKAPLKMIRADSGGHLGFCFHQTSKDTNESSTLRTSSWAAHELGQFVAHVQSMST